jgi:putative DNA primase/helicase
MLVGLKAYQREGLNPPMAVCDATNAYRADMDLAAQWLAERCDQDDREKPPGKASETPLKELAADFNSWAKNEIRRPWPNVTLSDRLKELGLGSKHTKTGASFLGVRLRHEDLLGY